jgi:CRISPR-associated protein Cas2
MLIIVTYDITDDKTRTRLFKKLKDFGPRVQYSVFEADLTKNEYDRLLKVLAGFKIDNDDSIRLYRLCKTCEQEIHLWGAGEVTDERIFI